MPLDAPRLESVSATLSFTRPEDVSPDVEQPRLKRARTLPRDDRPLDPHSCRVLDGSALDGFRPDIREIGFTYADLSSLANLQAVFERVRAAGEVSKAEASEIRRELRDASLPLANGQRLRILFVAPEGFIMRRSGPNGLSVNPDQARLAMNYHEAAGAVHADQDVTGTPLKQMMRHAAPWLFHHESPGRSNRLSPLFLLNVWIPLDQVTRPLALMDGRSLDRLQHQLRYGLPTETFLDRDEDRRVNDIWTFLHDERQRWYFTSEMDSNTAYIFETLSTPHGSFILPGEDRAEALYLQLRGVLSAVESGDEQAIRDAAQAPHPDSGAQQRTPSLQRAITAMEDLVAEARARAPGLAAGEGAAEWMDSALRASNRVVRKSLEMRAVGLITPDVWPLNRR